MSRPGIEQGLGKLTSIPSGQAASGLLHTLPPNMGLLWSPHLAASRREEDRGQAPQHTDLPKSPRVPSLSQKPSLNQSAVCNVETLPLESPHNMWPATHVTFGVINISSSH